MFVVAGCSSIADDDRQVMTVKTPPSGPQCTLQNKEGEFVVGSSPETLKIETACEEVTIICKKDGYKDTSSSVHNSDRGIVWDNVILGGVIGYAVDSSSGAACHYPSSAKLVFEEL